MGDSVIEWPTPAYMGTSEKERKPLTKKHLNQYPVEDFMLLWTPIMRNAVRFEPNQAVLEDLISSGNLSKISNVQLRRGISKWKALVNGTKGHQNAVSARREEVIRMMKKNGPIRSIHAATGNLNIEKSRFDISLKGVLSDPEFENYLSYWMIYSRAIDTRTYRYLESEFVDILDLIDRELGK